MPDASTPSPILERAMEAYDLHRSLALDLNQPRAMREAHLEQARKARGIILEILDE